MAKITAYASHTGPIATDLLPIVDVTAGQTKKITTDELLKSPMTGRYLSMRPAFVAGRIQGTAKPASVNIGAYAVYSMPIYNNDGQELYWRLQVPGRWDGASNPIYYLVVALSEAETLGDDFRMQLSWSSTNGTTGVLDIATNDITADGDCSAGHNSQYSVFKLSFSIDYTIPVPDMAGGDVLTGRVRRIASGGTEVSGNIYIVDHWLTFAVNKIFKAS
jgi:hypothetical protein